MDGRAPRPALQGLNDLIFSRLGEPLYRIKSCAGMRTTNIAYGGPDRRTLFMTEASQNVIIKVQLPAPGLPMYSHS